MFFKKVIFSFLIAFLIQTIYSQETQRVYFVRAIGNDENNGRSEEQAFKTLTRAINFASAGPIKSIIIIGSLDERISLFNTGTSELKISGKDNSSERERARLIRGNVSISGNSNIHFENIEISGGTDSSWNERGGGINISNGARVTIGENVIIKNNRTICGGGISINNATCIMLGGEISSNIASGSEDTGGGGVYVTGGGTFRLDNGIIINNKTDIGAGGGICLHYGNLVMNGGTITGNESFSMGGGIGGWSASRYKLIINGGTISNNRTLWGDGGGIAYWGTVEMTGGEISGNITGSSSGGGILCDILLLSDGRIINNKAKEGGGVSLGRNGNTSIISGGEISDNQAERGAGIFISDIRNSRNTLILQNGLLRNNIASFLGGGIYISNSNTFQIRGGSIIENSAEFLGGGIYFEEGSRFIRNGGIINQNSTNDGEGVDIYQQ